MSNIESHEMQSPSEILARSVPGTAKVYGIGTSTLFRFIAEGQGPRVVRIGGRTLVLCEDAALWFASKREASIQAPVKGGE